LTIENHPASMLFPMMELTEIKKLADDIRDNGQLEPITLYHGQILDGRNRYQACQLVGVEPRFREVDGELSSPVHYVISQNLHRRHLSVSQRAIVAAEMIPLLAEEAKKRQAKTQLKSNEIRSTPNGVDAQSDHVGASSHIAARALGIGSTSVDRALKAKRDYPELYEKAKRGEITVNAASKGRDVSVRRGRRNDKDADWQTDTERKTQEAESQRKKMWNGLGMVQGVCRWILEVDRGMVRSVAPDDLKSAAESARNSAKVLHKFARIIEGGNE